MDAAKPRKRVGRPPSGLKYENARVESSALDLAREAARAEGVDLCRYLTEAVLKAARGDAVGAN